MASKPIEYDKTKKHDVETDAKDQHKFMVCIGGLLYLCLTRWDLIVDIVVLQQFVRKPNYGILWAHARRQPSDQTSQEQRNQRLEVFTTQTSLAAS